MSANLTMLKDSTFCASKKINPLPLCKFSKTTKWSLLKKVHFIDILVYTQCISNTTFLKKTKKNVKKEMLIVTFRNISILKDQGFFLALIACGTRTHCRFWENLFFSTKISKITCLGRGCSVLYVLNLEKWVVKIHYCTLLLNYSTFFGYTACIPWFPRKNPKVIADICLFCFSSLKESTLEVTKNDFCFT